MTQRSFSLTNAAIQAKAHRDIWSSSHSSLSPSERKGESSTEVSNLENDSGVLGLNLTSSEGDLNIDTDITLPLPRKATLPNKSNATKSTGPALRPKRIPIRSEKTIDLDEKMSPFSNPINDSSLTLSSKPLEKKLPPFSERYERVTTYLEKPLFHRVHELHQSGEIAKIASLFNAAIREYLDHHYSIS